MDSSGSGQGPPPQNLDCHHKIGYGRFLPHPSRFITLQNAAISRHMRVKYAHDRAWLNKLRHISKVEVRLRKCHFRYCATVHRAFQSLDTWKQRPMPWGGGGDISSSWCNHTDLNINGNTGKERPEFQTETLPSKYCVM
jgi:hypothetical protein